MRDHHMTAPGMVFETLTVENDGSVLFAGITAPPMNLLGPELMRDLVSLVQRAEANDDVAVIVFKSTNTDYFTSHVDITRVYRFDSRWRWQEKPLFQFQCTFADSIEVV
jgi:enoyl-CoA hydratase/carnithine racemase